MLIMQNVQRLQAAHIFVFYDYFRNLTSKPTANKICRFCHYMLETARRIFSISLHVKGQEILPLTFILVHLPYFHFLYTNTFEFE